MPNWNSTGRPILPRSRNSTISYAVNVTELEGEFGVSVEDLRRDAEVVTGRAINDVSAVVVILCGFVFLVIVIGCCIWM